MSSCGGSPRARAVDARLVGTDAPIEVFRGLADELEATAARLAEFRQVSLYTGNFATSLAENANLSGESNVEAGGPLENGPVLGLSNALAPPLRLEFDGYRVHGSVTFGKAYEGAPGCVHGAFVAAVFDALLALAQSLSGRSGMTVQLLVKFRAPTPLYVPLHAEARLQSQTGRKLTIAGTLTHGDTLCAEAEGLFILLDPEHFADAGAKGGRLLPLGDLDPPAGVPRLDDEAVAGVVEMREHHFVDVDAEGVRVVFGVVVRHLDRPAGELALADPLAGLVGRVGGRPVDRDRADRATGRAPCATAPSSRRAPRRRRTGSPSR